VLPLADPVACFVLILKIDCNRLFSLHCSTQTKEPSLYCVHIAVEMAPIAKVRCTLMLPRRSPLRRECHSLSFLAYTSGATGESLLVLPFPQVGGLGDVVTALGRAVQEQGHLVEVILPK
jgi:hypothetical protein